jgi:hypothetical protein
MDVAWATSEVLGTVTEDCCLVGPNAVKSGRSLPTFQEIRLPLFSGTVIMELAGSFETSVYLHQTARRYITGNIILQE